MLPPSIRNMPRTQIGEPWTEESLSYDPLPEIDVPSCMIKVAPGAICATEPPPFVSYVLRPDAARHPSMVPLAKVSVPAATPKAPPGFAAEVLALVLVTLRTVAPSMVNEPPFTVMRAEVRV